jgi:hypothetical protein
VIIVKILSLGAAERYAVRRLVSAAHQDLLNHFPGLDLRVSEVDDSGEINRLAPVLVLPTLVINEKVVCSGRFPTRQEISGWLQEACC